MTTTATQERPILFSAEMVRAILRERKTQTRRVIIPQPAHRPMFCPYVAGGWSACADDGHSCTCVSCPNRYGFPGGQLWVREAWLELDRGHYRQTGPRDKLVPGQYGLCRNGVAYRADCDADSDAIRAAYGYKWRPSIHMPRWASRITLEVTEVRAQKLQEISAADAEAEGVDAIPSAPASLSHRTAFAGLWNKINAKRGHSWEIDPWVWAITFKLLKAKP